MIALVTTAQIQRMREDFTKVLFSQQTALINRTAEELDDKLGMLLDTLTLAAKQQPRDLTGSADTLRDYYSRNAILALFDDLTVLDPRGEVTAAVPPLPGRVCPASPDRPHPPLRPGA